MKDEASTSYVMAEADEVHDTERICHEVKYQISLLDECPKDNVGQRILSS